jgi:hypothetical protein
MLHFEGVCRCLEQTDTGGNTWTQYQARRGAQFCAEVTNLTRTAGGDNLSEFTDNTKLSNSVDRQNEAKWAARLVGAGSLLTLVYETAFLVLDRRFLSLSDPPVLIFHSINIALFLLAVFMVASGSMDAWSLETGSILIQLLNGS